MTRSTILAGSLALIATVTVVSVHCTDAQDGPRPIPANLTSYLVPFRQLYDLETSFPRWPLPAGERAYASFHGARIKQDDDAITAISRRSREGGTQYWGRLAGSPSDAATRTWMGDRFQQFGATDIREQTFPDYAKQPAASRRRTLRFAATPAHHAGDVAARWMRHQRAVVFAKTALILNIEHTSTMEVSLQGPCLRRSNMIGAKRWAVYRSHGLEKLLVHAFDAFGVTAYAEPDANAGGALAAIRNDAPSFMFNEASTYHHTTADTSAVVPMPGLEASSRAFASIIDQANRLSREELAK